MLAGRRGQDAFDITKARLPLLLGLLMGSACLARASIYYDEEARCIRVVDFPEHAPCTLERLLYMDRLCGWGKVVHEPQQDSYTVTGDLWVGSNDGTDTYLQIAGPEHPHETLIMRGNLLVYPYWIEGENPEEHYSKMPEAVNRLTVGVPGDASVAGALKFLDEADAGYSLSVGRFPLPDGSLGQGYGGQLHVYHGTITSATPEPGGQFGASSPIGGMNLCGNSVVLDHATLSWIAGAATYGMGYNGKVAHTLFEHLGTAIINGKHDLVGCTFSNCEVAVRDYGSLDAVLTDCIFRDNDQNWTLTFSDRGLVCIDCTYDEPRKGNVYQAWRNKNTGQMQYPSFVSKRHTVVEVVDQAGQPVPGALVKVRCEQATSEIAENATQRTNQLGRTPTRGEDGAILLVEVVKQATEVPNQPKVTELTYAMEASAEGYAPGRLEHFRPVESWQVVRIVLGKR